MFAARGDGTHEQEMKRCVETGKLYISVSVNCCACFRSFALLSLLLFRLYVAKPCYLLLCCCH